MHAQGVWFPEASLTVTSGAAVRIGMCGLWLVSGLVLAAGPPRTGWRLWAGAGYTVIAVAHTFRMAAGTPAERGMVFAVLRFVGLAVVLVGVVPAARRVLAEAFETRLAQLAELAEVRAGLQRAAHRDHELCTSVNALISATMLLDADDRDAADLLVLRTAVASELARLNELLHPPGPGGRATTTCCAWCGSGWRSRRVPGWTSEWSTSIRGSGYTATRRCWPRY